MERFLPAEIKLEIFSRLPAESVLQCRQVCKTWRSLLNHPHFAGMHLERSSQPDKLGLIYFPGMHCDYGKYCEYDNGLNYGEYDENDEQSYKTLKRINHPPLNMFHHVVGSCNGLICYSKHDEHDDVNNSIVIFNPITKEYVNLPSYDVDYTSMDKINRYFIVPIQYGFGYLPSTNEYKVVRIIFSGDRNQTESFEFSGNGSIQVYTLGSGSGWRNKGEIWGCFQLYCIHANGALHWLDVEEMKIMAFDLAEEKFRSLPSPPCFVPGEDYVFKLRFFGGLLCIVHYKRGESLSLWSLKEQEYTCCWHKECRMAWEGQNVDEYEPFALTKSGDVLMWYNQKISSPHNKHRHFILCRYDPKVATLKKLDTEMLFLEAIPHKNSFVSLKDLGEEDTKILSDQVREHS